jgi:hypothetical protein
MKSSPGRFGTILQKSSVRGPLPRSDSWQQTTDKYSAGGFFNMTRLLGWKNTLVGWTNIRVAMKFNERSDGNLEL